MLNKGDIVVFDRNGWLTQNYFLPSSARYATGKLLGTVTGFSWDKRCARVKWRGYKCENTYYIGYLKLAKQVSDGHFFAHTVYSKETAQ